MILGCVTLGAWGLVAGYGLGMSSFEDPWIIPTVSLASILVIEPILVFALYNTLPSWRSLGGLMLGGVGMLLVLSGE